MRALMPVAALLLLATSISVPAQESGNPARGRAYAMRACAECHGIEAGDTLSPRLGLATFKVIANTPGMTGLAIAVWLKSPHPTMPNLIVPPDDIDDLAAYITSLKGKP